jgi:hypothetical protein
MMRKLSAKWVLLTIIAMGLAFIGATFAGPVLAIKKSSNIHTNASLTAGDPTTHHQIKGVKILGVKINPSTVAVGNTFSIRGIVVNNSTATIRFANGTCNSTVSIDFNKNVIIENQGVASCTTNTPEVILKPREQSAILIPNHSGIAYKATAPGMTNATISLSYGVEIPKGQSATSESISRVYSFNIKSALQGTSSKLISNPSATNGTIFYPPGSGSIGSGLGHLLSIKYPHQNLDVPAGSLIAVGGTSAPSNGTHINCNVAIQTNQHGFVQASAHGPKGSGDYTKWTAVTATPIQQGLNQIEAQLQCFPPGKVLTPNLIKHLVHNVTGLPVVGMPATSQLPSPHSQPSKQTTPTSPSPRKAPTAQDNIPLVPHT